VNQLVREIAKETPVLAKREPHDPDWRDASLRIVLDSVTVHRVRRVEFDTEEFSVTRRRWEKRA
jgi:hypothetical protein